MADTVTVGDHATADTGLQELGYGVTELAELLRTDANDVRQLYGIQKATEQRTFLHLIK